MISIKSRFDIKVKIIDPGGIKTNFINYGTDWASHPLYADLVDSPKERLRQRVKQFSERLNDSLPEPEGVAKTIYRAATDRIPLIVKLTCSCILFCPIDYGES
jgi:hypothetical protein